MNKKTRVNNFVLNMKVGVLIQILSPILAFVSRTVFIKVLGEEYLGINGLFSNILSLLSLADLGLYTAMIYSLYDPIARDDKAAVAGLIRFFKKIYTAVALVVFAIGLCLTPFLQYIIKGSELELRELRTYFILYLMNTASSYLIVYKTTLLKADQRIFITKITDFIAKVLLEVLQITILLLTHNYLFFLCINLVVVLSKNFITSKIADHMYPYLKTEKGVLDGSVKTKIVSNIKSTFIYKLSNIVINSTANILISVLLGVVIVGRYSNYLQIITIIDAFVMLVSESLLASLGNFNAKESPEEKLKMFRSMTLAYYLIATFCACCFAGMFNDFMNVWLGGIDSSYILSNVTVYVITFNFFIKCVISPLWLFRETAGLFHQVKYLMAIAAVLNIVLAVILGKLFGLAGILIATSLSTICTNFWYEPMILHRTVFRDKLRHYWLYVAKLLGISFACVATCAYVGLIFKGSLITAFVKIAFAGVITASVYLLFFYRSVEFSYLKNHFLAKLLKRKPKEKEV